MKVWSMAKVSPIQFFKQVRQEVSKVTWATRKEVIVTSIMVFVLGSIAAAFFFFIDSSISYILMRIFKGLSA
jgi:preprotein translocase subunit SecE